MDMKSYWFLTQLTKVKKKYFITSLCTMPWLNWTTDILQVDQWNWLATDCFFQPVLILFIGSDTKQYKHLLSILFSSHFPALHQSRGQQKDRSQIDQRKPGPQWRTKWGDLNCSELTDTSRQTDRRKQTDGQREYQRRSGDRLLGAGHYVGFVVVDLYSQWTKTERSLRPQEVKAVEKNRETKQTKTE